MKAILDLIKKALDRSGPVEVGYLEKNIMRHTEMSLRYGEMYSIDRSKNDAMNR